MKSRSFLSTPLSAGLTASLCALAGTAVGVAAGPWLLPFLQALFFFPVYYSLLRSNRWGETLLASLLWALTVAAVVATTSCHHPEYMGHRILLGEDYRREMFEWVATGVGRESDPARFIPQHFLHLGIFCLLTALSGGFLGLVMGSVLMNYMSYYVGTLVAHSLDPVWVSLLAWPPWAALRVTAFVLIAMGLSALFYRQLLGAEMDSRRIRQAFHAGGILVIGDILLKWALAPTWQRWLKMATDLSVE